jgi:type II secretory pathway predicted ATPase ExeA
VAWRAHGARVSNGVGTFDRREEPGRHLVEERGVLMHYYEYWGLNKAPFDNVPDPSMYVSSHASAANAITETLFAIEEGNECLAVIVGDVGLGKTMSLRMVIDSLDQEKYRIAFIVNPDMSFVQLLKEIIGQLTGVQCEIKKKLDLLETFNRLLFETVDLGKKVVIFIDEANAMSPSNLEKMRLLTNLQPDDLNLFTIVLAGQIEFAKRLSHPKRANLFQRVGTYSTLEKIDSPEMVRLYVDTRLSLAGGSKNIFTEDAMESLWKHSEYGVPRLINKLCKLSLKAGETNGLQQIEGTVIGQIADRFQKIGVSPAPKRRPVAEIDKTNGKVEIQPAPRREETRIESQIIEPTPPVVVPRERIVEIATVPQVYGESEPAPAPMAAAPLVEERAVEEVIQVTEVPKTDEELPIDQYGVNVSIPADVLGDSHFLPEDQITKLAGVLAAQTIQKYPRLTATWGVDPLAVWSEIREVILVRLRQGQNGTAR